MKSPNAEVGNLILGGRDIVVFAEELLGVRLNPGQRRWLRYAAATNNGWEWVWKQGIHVAANQIGKAQPVDEPVLTPNGWRDIGSLRPGDAIFAGDGSVTAVTGVFPQGVRPVYRLTFDDGAQTRSCDEHLWIVRDPESRFRKVSPRYGAWDVRTLADLRAAYGDTPTPPRRWAVPAPGAVEYPGRDVPIEPYAMGLLLGDGCFRGETPSFSSAEPELAEAVGRAIPGIAVRAKGKYDHTLSRTGVGPNPLTEALRGLRLWGANSFQKFIPPAYSENAPAVRLAVLQGLMDTDGTVGRKGAASFSTVSPDLALGVVDLVRSLGGKAAMRSRQTHYTHGGERRPGQLSYYVAIRFPGQRLFRLERKQRLMGPGRTADRIIHRIEPAGEAECVCISVAHPDQSYITRDYVVTHNSLAVAIFILWACTYKIGVDPSDPKAWAEKPYLWFHLAPTQQQAYHVLNDARLLVKGAHPAQTEKVRFPQGLVVEAKVATYYDGLEWPVTGAVCQFRTTDDKASALQGYRANGISVDEAAFEDHLKVVVNETLMMRLISTGGPLHLVSTPNGMNDYFDLVEEVRKYNTLPEDRVWVDEAGRSFVAWSVISDNVGYGITQAQVDHMEASLDPATKEQQLRGAFLEPAEAFFVPTERILAAFRRSLPEEEAPRAGHKYVAFWDPSVSSDPTAVVVIDVTKKPWRGVYFRHYQRPMAITQLLNEMAMLHTFYNSAEDPRHMVPRSTCTTGYDATSMGGKMFTQMLTSIRPSKPVNFGGPDKKLKSLSAMRAVLTAGDLWLPEAWTRMRQEILSYRLKDDKLRQDCVMALDGAVDVANGGLGIGAKVPMSVHGRITPTRTWR